MSKLLSLTSSGESLEKTVALCYYAYNSNPAFYSNYSVLVFYGHNLPKKEKQLFAHGSVGFYRQYFVNPKLFPFFAQDCILLHQKDIIDYLLSYGFISKRNTSKLLDRIVFQNIINQLPIDYLAPGYHDILVNWITSKYPNLSLERLYLENRFPEFVFLCPPIQNVFSIYALSLDGTVGRYYINTGDLHRSVHISTDLQKCMVLSGNSAVFLSEINNRIGGKTIVGYRMHNSNLRPNREYALQLLIRDRETVIEPKNTLYNAFYSQCSFLQNMSMEEKGNIVLALAFEKMIQENKELFDELACYTPEWI